MWIKLLFLVLTAVLVSRILRFVYVLGPHRTLHAHSPGPCRNIAPITSGAEGIALSKNGLAFLSSGYKTDDVTDERIRNAKGKIYTFDFNKPDDDASEMKIVGDVTLVAPHGISLWEGSKSIFIFVVNHGLSEDTVEIFKYNKTDTLTHLKTVRSPLFTSLNDVVAISDVSFYVTNDSSRRAGLLKIIELALLYPGASVVFYDGERGAKVVDRGTLFNGIAQSTDGRFVFVSHMLDQAIDIYQHEEDNSLSQIKTISLGSVPDNIFYDPVTGDLLVSCTIPFRYFQTTADYDLKGPSHLLQVKPSGGKDNPFETYRILEIFADDGNLLSSSSSAAIYKNQLLLGSVLEKAAYCRIIDWKE
ncbi:Serum paraoxonase/arylesterase 1 [Holothuria leucospilota]|uniref:Paraoxonase n=1 Tax=Holothuria leucospilota TaxID=206669 RepID=A0A9Q1C735_HOLLE|nr:Serum paraoxonase/arylesterase 1 [Holothuria leucospilota]